MSMAELDISIVVVNQLGDCHAFIYIHDDQSDGYEEVYETSQDSMVAAYRDAVLSLNGLLQEYAEYLSCWEERDEGQRPLKPLSLYEYVVARKRWDEEYDDAWERGDMETVSELEDLLLV